MSRRPFAKAHGRALGHSLTLGFSEKSPQTSGRDSQNWLKYSSSSVSDRPEVGFASKGAAPAGLRCGFEVDPGMWAGFWYMFWMTRVWENWGRVCLREQRSPWRQAPILR